MDEQMDPNQERIAKVRGPGYEKVTINQVYEMLASGRFTEWYLTRFEQHVGDYEAVTKNEILLDLRGLLK